MVGGRKRWWSQKWQPTPVLLPGKYHGWRSLAGYSPLGHEELDMTEQLHVHFLLSCIGEGNGNPLQCSCLENPRDWGAWWAAVYGVTQSWTWLKWLSSSSRKRWKSTDSWNYILKESYPIRNTELDLMLVKKNLFLYMYTLYMYMYSVYIYI